MSTVIAMESLLARTPPPCGMSWIAGGTFEETPAHVVAVSSFYMDRTAVTNAQYARFVRATGYLTVPERPLDPAQYAGADPARAVPGACWRAPEGPGSTLKGREDHPVVQVAYEDALAYANWAGKTLPTEAEWEYAARGDGLYEMTGNLWEWTSDWYRDAPPNIRARCKVLKGGSDLCAPNYRRRDRPAARYPQPVDTASSHIGFRCVWHERF
jgi:formylglycine-generating enzyme